MASSTFGSLLLPLLLIPPNAGDGPTGVNAGEGNVDESE
jgi:hypothetical protein